MPYGILEPTWRRLLDLLSAQPEIQRAVLYGSRAIGTARPGSDIDIVVEGPGISLETILRLRSLLRQSSIPYVVDVLAWDQIRDPAVRDHIVRRGIVIWKRPSPAPSDSAGASTHEASHPEQA